MRSQGSTVLQWWVVDPTSGTAAFHGGDIVAICNAAPGYRGTYAGAVVCTPAAGVERTRAMVVGWFEK